MYFPATQKIVQQQFKTFGSNLKSFQNVNLYLINYILIPFFWEENCFFIEPSKFRDGLRRLKIN